MKKLFLILALAGICFVDATAQKKIPETVTFVQNAGRRTEIILPKVNGLNIYKADLHTHSIYSDANLTPEQRVKEAWLDGLDIFSMTDHVEYRRHEKTMLKFLKGYNGGEAKKAINANVIRKPANSKGILADLNVSTELAQKEAKVYGEGLLIIPGCEITREPKTIGHFNALFTTDNNTIYAPDAMQSLRNAKAQNALVMHNHPGWTHKDMKLTPFEKEVYKAGLLDGIEVVNTAEFYPQAITRAEKYGLFISSNSDIHYASEGSYRNFGGQRNMTIIFAKDKSLESLREAIDARRTLAYSYGTLAGEESLLRKFFEASVSVREISVDKKGRRQIIVTNNSSVEWWLVREGQKAELLEANSSIILGERTSTSNTFTLLNTWCGEDKHITVELFK